MSNSFAILLTPSILLKRFEVITATPFGVASLSVAIGINVFEIEHRPAFVTTILPSLLLHHSWPAMS